MEKETCVMWRIVVARLLFQMSYQEENGDRTITCLYNRIGEKLLGVTYKTFVRYLNVDVGDLSAFVLPDALVLALWQAVESLNNKAEVEFPVELVKRLARPLPPRNKRGPRKKTGKVIV